MAARVTITEVAARAGVSISSVSAALNGRPGVSDRTREKIVALAEELGFVPSVRGRSLAGKRTYAVGLVVHRDPDVLELDPFFGAFIGGIESYIDRYGFALVLQTSSSRDQVLDRYRRLAAGRRVDGVFLNELEVDDARIDVVRELGLPTVGINADADFPLPSVRQDHAEGIRDTVEHLVALGHRDIAFVGGPPHYVHSRQRERAWRESITACGLSPRRVVLGAFTYESGLAAAAQLLAGDERPTAVVCANDLSAMGFIAQAEHLGLSVPRDLSVTGFDGIQLGAYLRPSLTTVQTSPKALGAEAARMLLALLDDVDVADTDIPAASFVVRDSTGPAPR
ncbi:LacI family DNA-binding transcriptional regulator [Microbacterium horticulturae]|uniref:LacI family DNA-binding transcriptional regulator n=1 Tax=Microbacterium horticulturae TaxID=3028316 RepID=A0ABY8C586_9MICO|nr:LacI family DNA-binding transcriptional regulator [Microbacterium sp. KACC 23027]WEG09798.1 LacI family DNA-binding transcriptional regulator [Microbacterium sp. KACC 23027]